MFFLSREWQDPEDGIETVILHWTVTRLEKKPCWTKANQVVLVARPATYPVRRRCTMWITPPFSQKHLLTMDPAERPAGFLVHHFFEVIQRGRVWNTEPSREEMQAVTITHSDPSAECTQAFLHYSLDELEHVHCIAMVLEGLPVKYQLLSSLPEESLSAKDRKARTKRYECVTRLSPPHTFRGQIWGPLGTRVLYAVYFSRQGMYNPFSEGGFWLLKDGGFWEVKL